MIAFDFNYFKPSTISEAVDTFNEARERGEKTIYYSGGTEIITFARVNKITMDTVIDSKGIPECNVLEIQGDKLVIGAAVSLNKITESNLFPLLGQTVKKIADHTSRNKITIGGNLNSQLMYREAMLPLLVANAKVRIAGKEGEEVLPLEKFFNKEIDEGKFLVQIIIDTQYVDLPFISLKRTRMSKVGYPVVSLAALMKNQRIRVAFSGISEHPFRSAVVEGVLNDRTLTVKERIDKAVAKLPASIVQDIHASAKYREFVLKNSLTDALENMEGIK
ncbi:FAD binding domain-containing protein [Sporosarcina limicola]|uniref:CO/xanthine dehydrogenase FAD-binding subunit n=1 Tax=Sporosarcina limicola TaxID=34101 RepID=A0A927MKL6_9BACL|nr:FAD binding domain-containing protein [Sporosarcina limicola]MBE1556105.1 CO/xanthine dehydrogenase FAD-binding subunit [Sporosarcina limicola]